MRQRLSIGLGLSVMCLALATARADLSKPTPSAAAAIELGVLVGQHGKWTGGRDGIKLDGRGVDARFTVPTDATRTPRPLLQVTAYTSETQGARTSLHVRLIEESTNKVVGASAKTCWCCVEGHRSCELPIGLGAQAITYRVELSADHPMTVGLGVVVLEPYEH
jgi:hypothetical protein